MPSLAGQSKFQGVKNSLEPQSTLPLLHTKKNSIIIMKHAQIQMKKITNGQNKKNPKPNPGRQAKWLRTKW